MSVGMVSIMGITMIPVQVRVTRKLLEELDRILDKGIYSSRSEIIRDALRKHINGIGEKDKQLLPK
jgi:metal-responsive CopG/Arc/MetJ family transcriptional regulator